MIDKMGKEKKSGQMEQAIQDNTKMERKMEKVYLNGLMALFMLETSSKIIFKVKVSIVGRMVENM